MNCLFLISDEGSGHTVRQSCIANELIRRGANVVFQCKDPVHFAKKVLDSRIKIHERFNLIRLIKQKEGVNIDETYKFFNDYIKKSKEWINNNVKSTVFQNTDLIVTDIVEESGIIAKKLNKPVIAITHFTWHWLLKELDPKFTEIAEYLEDCLSGITRFLFPPFSKHSERFPNATPINLIVRKPRSRPIVRKELKVQDDEIMVLFSGGLTSVWNEAFSLLNGIKNKEIFLFSNRYMGSQKIKIVDNPFNLHDYINASDLVVSRGGFGTISETLAFGVRHLILLEKNHPEAIENARLLKSANRAIVKSLKDFLSDPYGIIEECLETRLELSQMECNGHLQAIDKIYELYNSTKVLFP